MGCGGVRFGGPVSTLGRFLSVGCSASNISHLVGNMVGVSTLTDSNADAVIAQVQEFFGKRKCAFERGPMRIALM